VSKQSTSAATETEISNQSSTTTSSTVPEILEDTGVLIGNKYTTTQATSTTSNRTPGSAVVIPGGANNTFAAALTVREYAIFQQIQQEQGAAAKNCYLEELCKREQAPLCCNAKRRVDPSNDGTANNERDDASAEKQSALFPTLLSSVPSKHQHCHPTSFPTVSKR